MIFTEKQLEELGTLAGLNYTFKQIAMYFDLPLVEILSAYNDLDSDFRYHYDRGQLMASAEIDKSNLDSAKKGNITSQQRYDKRQKEIQLSQAKQRIFGRT